MSSRVEDALLLDADAVVSGFVHSVITMGNTYLSVYTDQPQY